jgi:hypothetical protein
LEEEYFNIDDDMDLFINVEIEGMDSNVVIQEGITVDKNKPFIDKMVEKEKKERKKIIDEKETIKKRVVIIENKERAVIRKNPLYEEEKEKLLTLLVGKNIITVRRIR